MNSSWSTEFTRLFFVFCSTVLFGLISEYWLLSVIIHSSLYIAWNIVQLLTFERWIRRGAPSKNAPDVTGVWQLIVQHIYRSQKSHNDRKKQLTKVANHYHAVMSALPDATLVLNDNFEIEWANKRCQKMLGIDVNKDLGHRLDNIIRGRQIQKLFESDDSQLTIELISPVDPLINLAVTKKEFADNKTLIIVRDISQRIAIQKLRKAFIANASHELRTPLTVISGYLEILDSDDNLPDEIAVVIKNSLDQAVRMEQILDDLLVLSKLEENKTSEDSVEIVDVPRFLNRLVADFNASNSKAGRSFILDIDTQLNLKIIEHDFFSLCQNLINNAIKYSPDGSTIIIRWAINNEDEVCLSVIDEGEGIAEKYLSRLTERFYRINLARNKKVDGTGLGLSIVKHILDNFGGHLIIKSKLKEGSTFSACFPRSRAFKNE